jgi:hypothetical protein
METYGHVRAVFKSEVGPEESIYPLLDQLGAFPNHSNFAWLSFNDVHHSMRLTPEPSV